MHQKPQLCLVSVLLVVASCTEQPFESPAPEPLQARVIECRGLLYTDGAEPEFDQPAYVRAGSATRWLGARLAVVQDDALIIALVDPHGGRVDALLLPADPNGHRLFDTERGNKSDKLDFEAAFTHNDTLYGFGSGSSPHRESVVIVGPDTGHPAGRAVRMVEAQTLYAALRANKVFSGSELNIEGTVIAENSVRLFQRGNGAPIDGLEPVDATCNLDVGKLLQYLEDPDRHEPPPITDVRQYNLGRIENVRLNFSDATVHGGNVIFLAVAEDSPDTLGDGPVTGVVVGIMATAGPHNPAPRWVRLVGENGRHFTGKAEGIVLDPTNPNRAFIVLDRDDPDIPAEMCTVALTGFEESPVQ